MNAMTILDPDESDNSDTSGFVGVSARMSGMSDSFRVSDIDDDRSIRVDATPAPDGGREWVRTIACAHCASADVVGVESGTTWHGVHVIYRCGVCARYTWLVVRTGDAGRCYVRRFSSQASDAPVKRP